MSKFTEKLVNLDIDSAEAFAAYQEARFVNCDRRVVWGPLRDVWMKLEAELSIALEEQERMTGM